MPVVDRGSGGSGVDRGRRVTSDETWGGAEPSWAGAEAEGMGEKDK